MFIKVNRISHNSYDSEKEYLKETLINTDLITSVKEMVSDPTRLYDEEGNLVKEEESEVVRYHVYQTTGPRIVLDKENYDILVKALTK